MKILIIGSSGMVGSEVLKECIKNPLVKEITLVNRKKNNIKNKKIKEIILSDFSKISSIKDKIINKDLCFYCLGTYQGEVSKKDFIKITFNYFQNFIKVIESKKTKFCLLSAAGADSKSILLFAKWKGKCEEIIIKSKFKNYYIFRPGYIHPLDKSKLKKSIHYKLIEFFYPLIDKILPSLCISSDQLAKAMVKISIEEEKSKIINNLEARNIFHLPSLSFSKE